jgi:hypothetical protein
MDKLDDKNIEAFGDAIYNIHKTMDISGVSLGVLVENIYLRFQKEAERDARDKANGKSSN